MPGATAWAGADDGDKVTVHLTLRGKRSTIEARKILIADGVNSRMAEALGMNQGRTHFVTTQCVIYLLEGVEDPEPHRVPPISAEPKLRSARRGRQQAPARATTATLRPGPGSCRSRRSARRQCGAGVHVKTAGTSWLEAVRVAAVKAPGFGDRRKAMLT